MLRAIVVVYKPWAETRKGPFSTKRAGGRPGGAVQIQEQGPVPCVHPHNDGRGHCVLPRSGDIEDKRGRATHQRW